MPVPLLCKVSAEKSSDSLMEVLLYKASSFSLAAFKSLSLSLIFDILIIMYLGMDLFGFILFGNLCAPNLQTWMSVSFPRLGKFSAIISSNKSFVPFLLLRPL